MSQAKHIAPSGYDFGKWMNAYQCRECGTIGDILAMSTFRPCPACGSQKVGEEVAKFDNGVWQLRRTKMATVTEVVEANHPPAVPEPLSVVLERFNVAIDKLEAIRTKKRIVRANGNIAA